MGIMPITLLEAKKFRVEQWELVRNGRQVVRQIVVHPGAVVILPLLDDEHVVAIHNYREAVGGELFELPAGTLETSEPPVECATRELQEETGYRAAKIEPLVEFFTTPGICTELMHAFVARDLTPVGTNLDETEQIRTEIVTLADCRKLIRQGKIKDGKTIATLATYFMKQAQ